jgi:hypothetical protein
MTHFEAMSQAANSLPPEPWLNRRWREIRRFMFRRGYMPDSCLDELQERVSLRVHEIVKPLQHVPNRTALTSDVRDYDSYRLQIESAERESASLFLKVLSEEAEKQWNKVVDGRAEQFFFVVVGLALGIPIGLFF